MQITPKIEDIRDNSETILESCTAMLRAQDLDSIRNEFNTKNKFYIATSKISAIFEIIGISAAIIILIPLIILKFTFMLVFRHFMD